MRSFLSSVILLTVCTFAAAQGQPEPRWYKGNLHTHTLWSDGDGFPEMVVDWYRTHGYQFLALSDHNVLSEGERWLPLRDIHRRTLDLPLEKYRERFPDVAQIRTSEAGDAIRIQPLDKIRELFEKPGEFIMIQSEELTDKFITTENGKPTSRPVHMNATNVAEVIKPQGGSSAREVIRRNLQAVEAQAKRLNRPMVTHLNHPNFGWGVTAEDLASVVEERYFEIYNGHPATHALGDATHPNLEKLWDIANTIRLAQLHAEPLMGLATDDSHHYHTTGINRATPGRGWVMIRSAELTPDAVVSSLKRGDFYATSGVTLREIRFDPATKTLSLEIEPDADATFTTTFVGTPKDFSATGQTPLDSDAVGKTFATESGLSPKYTLKGDELYVRAIINSSKPPAVPSYENQNAQAWTQPAGWR